MARKTVARIFRGALLLAGVIVAPTAQAKLIVNGDFEAGNAGFGIGPGYSYLPSGFSTPGRYGVVRNPATAYTNGYTSSGDRTTGSGLNLFIDAVDFPATPVAVWTQTVAVDPFTDYTFAGFAREADTTNNPATLRFYVGSTALCDDFTLAMGRRDGVWQGFANTFDSGAATSLTLRIVDLNLNSGNGNDFVLDDLSLTGVIVPEPRSMVLAGLGGLSLAGDVATRRAFRRRR